MEGIRHIAIGGAYSVDKFFRLARGYGWWEDEQPSEETKAYVEQQLKVNQVDVVLSHTCPFRYEPTEVFLSGIDQSTVDTSMEEWLGRIEENISYTAWFCGHWHINKRIDKMHFLFHGFESSEQFQEIENGKQEITVKAGQFNSLMTFAVRYALGREVHAPDTVHNMIRENLENLNEQAKQGIIRDIRNYIAA